MCAHGFGSPLLGIANGAELSITADASADVVATGSHVTFTLTVTNEGPDMAFNVLVTDILPDGLTLVSCKASGAGWCGSDGQFPNATFGLMVAGAKQQVAIVATVSCGLADGAELVNVASVRESMIFPEAVFEDPGENVDENEAVVITISNPPLQIVGGTATPSMLWPPNHKMADITLDYRVIESCGPIRVALNVVALNASSNEPINGIGDGNTEPDWQIVDEHHIRLRAERAGPRTGRIYKIAITAVDSFNQPVAQTVTVLVPHDRSK